MYNSRMLTLLRRRGGGVSFTVTTTGAQSVSFDELDVAVGKTLTVKWGDGNSDDLTGEGTNVSHAYAGAGTWTVTFSDPTIITRFNCDDAKVGCDAGFIGSMVNLTTIVLNNLPNVTVGAGEIGGLTSLTVLYLDTLANVTVGSGEIGGLTNLTYLRLYNLANLTVGAGEIGGLTSLTYLNLNTLANVTVGAGEIATLTSLRNCYLINSDNIALQTDFPATIRTIQYENGLIEASVDAVLAGIYADRAAFTWATPSLDIAGDGNATPSGAYADEDPPSTGLGYVYELANDPETEGFNTWSITYEGGSAP